VQFWRQLYRMLRINPGGVSSYISTCAHAEHLLEYRQRVRQMIGEQLKQNLSAFDKTSDPPAPAAEPAPSERRHVQVRINTRSTSRKAMAHPLPVMDN
jgi:hypothetical protein